MEMEHPEKVTQSRSRRHNLKRETGFLPDIWKLAVETDADWAKITQNEHQEAFQPILALWRHDPPKRLYCTDSFVDSMKAEGQQRSLKQELDYFQIMSNKIRVCKTFYQGTLAIHDFMWYTTTSTKWAQKARLRKTRKVATRTKGEYL